MQKNLEDFNAVYSQHSKFCSIDTDHNPDSAAEFQIRSIPSTLFFKNGKRLNTKIIAISQKTITYRDTVEGAVLTTVAKDDVLLAEYKSGEMYVFGTESNTSSDSFIISETREERKERRLKEWRAKEQELPNGILGFYLPELVLGRLTVSYERLFADKTMGVTIPLSITYDPSSILISSSSTSSSSNSNTTNSTPSQNKSIGIITGLDINYYYELKPALKYYFGPRIRYGTDQLLGGIEGLSVQLQNGILKSKGNKFTSTFGIGVGFFKLSDKYAKLPGYEPKQVYPWASITWRLGFRL